MSDIFLLSTPGLDAFLANPKYQQWFLMKTKALAVYTPGSDFVAQWFPQTYFYLDALAIFDSALVTKNPGSPALFSGDPGAQALILQDANGNPVKINWQEADGSYHQYAANVASLAFQQRMITIIGGILKAGYDGIWLDDTDLVPSFVSASGKPATPFGFDALEWQWRFVEYLQAIRKAFPHIKILHNAVPLAPVDEAAFQAQVAAADLINIERGFGDPNFANDPSRYVALAQYIAKIHSYGGNVVVENYSKGTIAWEEPAFQAIRRPGDFEAYEDMYPDNWPL